MRATEHGLRIRIVADPPHNPVTDDDERLREKPLVDLYQGLSGNLGGCPACAKGAAAEARGCGAGMGATSARGFHTRASAQRGGAGAALPTPGTGPGGIKRTEIDSLT